MVVWLHLICALCLCGLGGCGKPTVGPRAIASEPGAKVGAPNADSQVAVQDLGSAGNPDSWSPASGFGKPINEGFAGVTCFRGNAQRNYYGKGPIPVGMLRVLWRQPIGSVDGYWNGVGWTGQPLAVEWPQSVRKFMNFLSALGPDIEIIIGGLDGQVHFYDSETGRASRKALKMPAPFPIKGTVSVHPRGYPLLFVGCGMNRGVPGYRVYSLLDFRELYVIRGLDSAAPRGWPAFDSNGIVLKDTLFVLGENGMFYKVALNTRWDAEKGKISVSPVITKRSVSAAGIESSISAWGDYGYFGDNTGNFWRINLSTPVKAQKIVTLGDDCDSTATFDEAGNLYVGIEVDKMAGKGGKGRLFKIRAKDAKVVWTFDFEAGSIAKQPGKNAINGGVVSTPAIWAEGDLVFLTTTHHPSVGRGSLIGLDRETGKPRWSVRMKGYGWSSPVVIDGRVLAVDSNGNVFIRDAATGQSLLTDKSGGTVESFSLGSHVEASPLVYKGRIYIGVRGGALICLGN